MFAYVRIELNIRAMQSKITTNDCDNTCALRAEGLIHYIQLSNRMNVRIGIGNYNLVGLFAA